MTFINKILKYLLKPRFLKLKLDRSNIVRLDDKKYIELNFEENLGYKLDLNNVKTFNEKLQWLKLNNRNPLYTNMVDKYEVKKIIAQKIGEEYIIPTIGIYNSWDEIDFNLLPDKFVIKCTHDSGGVFVCTDKNRINKEKIKYKINKKLSRNLFYNAREWPYKNVKPRIIIEKYMENENDSELKDYKFFCFNGKAKVILVCSERFSSKNMCETWFDDKWNLLDIVEDNHRVDSNIKKPINFDKMIKLANKLSKDIPFIRVDFYEINRKIYFGELTFFPASGFEKFSPKKWDNIFGDWIDLSVVKKDEK